MELHFRFEKDSTSENSMQSNTRSKKKGNNPNARYAETKTPAWYQILGQR